MQSEESKHKSAADQNNSMSKETPKEKIYQGRFAQGLMAGFGQLSIENFLTYNGQWLNGRPHGNGQCVSISERHFLILHVLKV